jgi:transmembrane sensor
MPPKMTVEELLLDETFVDYCVNNDSEYRSKWERLRVSDPVWALLMDEAKGLLSVMSPSLPDSEVQAEIDKLREQIGYPLPVEPVRRPAWKRAARILIPAAVAASIIITAFIFLNKPAEEPVVLAVTEHAAGFGERLPVTLPDGSKVILNSNSSLSYTSDYNKKERRLELIGEAFFEVAKNPGKQFIVSTGEFSSTAIGTAFYVRARQPRQNYSVDLLEGKLSVQNVAGNSLLLNAGENAKWQQNGFRKNHFDAQPLQDWISGKLQFQHAATAAVWSQLANYYAVEIEDLRKKTGTISITGDYSGKPLEDILKAICFSLSCKYTITNNKVIIQ